MQNGIQNNRITNSIIYKVTTKWNKTNNHSDLIIWLQRGKRSEYYKNIKVAEDRIIENYKGSNNYNKSKITGKNGKHKHTKWLQEDLNNCKLIRNETRNYAKNKQIKQVKVSKKGGKVIKQQQKSTNYKIKTNYYKEVQNDYKTKIKLYKRTTSTYHQRWAVTC